MNRKPVLINLLILLCMSSYTCYALPDNGSDNNSTIEEVLAQVDQYCGACHKVPPPNVMPKKFWPRAVKAMADLAAKEVGAPFIPEKSIKAITAYYYGSSPKALSVLPYYQNSQDAPTFIPSELAKKSAMPLVVNVKAVSLNTNAKAEFLIADAQKNQVLLLSQNEQGWQEKVLANIQVPSHTEVVDYDQDGDKDIIIAALGSMAPSEALTGKIMLLRRSDSGTYTQEIILENVGRITDARPVDLDNDGDLDIAVAVFGGGNVGEIAWLENTGDGKHLKHDIIKASGALNVSIVDLNNDGKMDIVSLIAQEYEMVFALINQGAGKFKQVALAEAPHPMFGSTGLKIVDLDGDKDSDILFTNGDAHDLHMAPKPYHGVQWLENKGNLNFQYHDIGRFYGAATAVAGDMDNDGDLDVVAGSWNNDWQDNKRQSLVWFENDGKQNFTRQNIASRPKSIVSFELKDMTGNGRLDIVAGVFRMDLLIKMMMDPQDKKRKSKSTTNATGLNSRLVLLENKSIIQKPSP
ncbi:MAG: VCBS repeat-containing protein [Colwellia sp.]|nr:VCBS repeat-containing protein [Colwellia sp.]